MGGMGGDPDDERLVHDARRGDRRALEVLVRRHYDVVWRSLARLSRDADEADAWTQETFLRAMQNLGGFRGEATVSTWIVRIGIHLALNARRRPAPASLDGHEPAAQGPDPARAAATGERRRLVRDGVDRLPGDLRAALLLTAFGGLSQREAAGELDCPEGTVAWRVFEAKRRLKEWLPDGM
jgi:RNA polymerase sigma-70 factor (ECF subfamily)